MADNGAQFTADELPEIPDSWQWGRLGDLVDQSRGICYGIVQPGKHDESGVPMVNSQDVLDGTVASRVEFRVAKELHARFKRSTIRGGEVLLTLVGANFGRVAIAPSSFAGFNCSRAVGIIPVLEHPQFVMFCLRSPLTRRFLDNWANTTAQPTFNLKEVANLPIPLPPLAEQKAIAAVLGALDDKIELSRRMNATLEAMARALFQSWFVDFDPVRAKLDGRPPAALDTATAALFPTSFQDSPLGLIPAGWQTSTIGAKLQTILGGTPSRAKPEYWKDGTVAWINSGKTNEFRIIEPSEWITKEALENSATKLLPRRTTVLAITGATLGQVSITEIECCANQSVVAISASDEFPTEFIYPWIEENIEKLIASQTGGAQQHINKGNVEELALLCPDRRIVAAYQTKAIPLFDQIAANCFQSRTLATLRDTLLPKLLSGELSVESVIENK
jgi:type I restriction enzyme S subunit